MKTNKENTKKKKTILVAGLSLLTVLGGTLAYFTTYGSFEHNIQTGIYQNTYTDTIESPDNWVPGQKINGDVKVTNTGTIDMGVRAKIETQWLNAKGEDIGEFGHLGTHMALYMTNAASWAYNGWDNYYYYGESKTNLTALKPGETTTSLIDYIEFNMDAIADLNKEVSEDGTTITFTSTGEGFDNAKLRVTITIETMQYDRAFTV